MIFKRDEKIFELSFINKKVNSKNDIRIKLESEDISDILNIGFVSCDYAIKKRKEGTEGLILCGYGVLCLVGSKIIYFITKQEFLNLINSELKIEKEPMFLGAYDYIDNGIVEVNIYYSKGDVQIKSKHLDLK